MDGIRPDIVIVDEEFEHDPDTELFTLKGGTVYQADPRRMPGYDSTLEHIYRCACGHPESYHTDDGRCMTIDCMNGECRV